ncbi:hypothetical protein GQ457_02G025980 [Hibiscus cannabinus]
MSESHFAQISNSRGSSSEGDSVGMEGNFSRQNKPQSPIQPLESVRTLQNPPAVQTIQRECFLSMKEMIDQFEMNLKQEQYVAQVFVAPSRAPIEKFLQHRAYPFAGTIEVKPEEEEYWLEHITQIITKQLSCSDEHKIECTVAFLIDEALSWDDNFIRDCPQNIQKVLAQPPAKSSFTPLVWNKGPKQVQFGNQERGKGNYSKVSTHQESQTPVRVYYAEERDDEQSLKVITEESMQILDWDINKIRNKSVPLVKVLWKNHGVEEVTWETEATMQDQNPHLFDSGKNSRTNSFLRGGELGCAIFLSSGKEISGFLALLFIWVDLVEILARFFVEIKDPNKSFQRKSNCDFSPVYAWCVFSG